MDNEVDITQLDDRNLEHIPFTPPEEVKLYHYNIKKPFKSIRKIYVRSYNSLGPNEDIDDVNEKLKEKASSLGANAVINVGYEQGILTLFRGIRGIGQAVYVENLEDVEKTHPPGTTLLIFMGFFWLWMGISGSIDFKQVFFPIGLLTILYGIFNRLGYTNKTYFTIFLGILILNGIILGEYALKNGFQLYNSGFYIVIGFFAMLLISFVYSYKNRKKDIKLSWKNQWGFK